MSAPFFGHSDSRCDTHAAPAVQDPDTLLRLALRDTVLAVLEHVRNLDPDTAWYDRGNIATEVVHEQMEYAYTDPDSDLAAAIRAMR